MQRYRQSGQPYPLRLSRVGLINSIRKLTWNSKDEVLEVESLHVLAEQSADRNYLPLQADRTGQRNRLVSRIHYDRGSKRLLQRSFLIEHIRFREPANYVTY